MQGLLQSDSGPSENDDLTKKGNKKKGPKRYVPQKNSVAYALLITLFRPEKAKGKAGHFGNSPMDCYSGWNCMKTLITRGLVMKSSCPAKYMLTEEGKEIACECLLRSGMIDSNKSLDGVEGSSNFDKRDKLRVDIQEDLPDLEYVMGVSVEKAAPNNLKNPKISIDVPPDYLDKFVSRGSSRQQIVRAFSEVTETSQ